MKAHPRICLTIDFSDTRKELIDDGFDVAIRMSPERKKTQATKYLFREERALLVSKSYLATKPTPVSPNDLKGWDWLLLSPVHNRGLNLTHSEHSSVTLKPHARCYSNNARSLFGLTLGGSGIAALPAFLLEDDHNEKLCRILADWELAKLHVFAEWAGQAPKHGLIKLLVSSLQDYDYQTQASEP
jgi:DNA-binding transcriptional LysR family regulator